VDEVSLSEGMRWVVCLVFPAAAILMPFALFLSVLSPEATEPNALITLAFVVGVVLAVGLLVLGVGLIGGRHAPERLTGHEPPKVDREPEKGKEMSMKMRATRRAKRSSSTKQTAFGRVAIGRLATGAMGLGALAVGATAVGAMAIGALAIRALAVKRGRIERLNIEELEVGRLRVRELVVEQEQHPRPSAQ
jgi:hypothetical protein